jgi:DNA-binding FadR family transcriptional regulator
MAKPPVKAKQLADALAERIRSGDLADGDWLPSERDLAAQHAVGRSTVRLALTMLAGVGLVDDLGTEGVRVRSGAPRSRSEGLESARLEDLESRVRVVEERLDRLVAGESGA